jgi:hypothetical protein
MKILEGGTKDEMRMFEALFHGSWPKLSAHALEECFLQKSALHLLFLLPNLRLVNSTIPDDFE